MTAVHVQEGEEVRSGQPLVTMSLDLYGRDAISIGRILDQAMAARRQAAGLENSANAAALGKQRADLNTQIKSGRQKAELLARQHQRAAERIARTQERLSSLKALFEKGFVSNLQVQQSEDALTEQQMQLLAIEDQQVSLGREQARLALELNELGTKAAQNEAAAADAEAALLEKQAATTTQQELVVVAPRSGRVAAIRVKAGDTVTAGGIVATVAPKRLQLRAELKAPSRAIGFLRAGEEVRLKFAAFPYETFGFGKGKVVSVSDAPVGAQTQDAASASGDPVYAVRVALQRESVAGYGRDWPLAAGMRVSGVVTLEKRTMLQWLLAPVAASRANAAG